MKVVLLEGRTDMFYIKKMYQLIGKDDNILYLPCGGASEIWPVIESFKWRWKDELTLEAWVDNDVAGDDAKDLITTNYPNVIVRRLGENKFLGSIEDIVGFLAPHEFDKYQKIEKKRVEAHNPKWIKNDYKDAKEELFAAIMGVYKTSDANKERITRIFTHLGITF